MINHDGSSAGGRGVGDKTILDPIRYAVELISYGLRRAGITDSGIIRAEILESAKEALEKGGIRLTHTSDFYTARRYWRSIPPACLAWPSERSSLLSNDQRVQETLFVRIERVVTEVLADL